MMNLEQLLLAATGLNLHTLAFFIATLWWFTKDLRADVKEIKQEMHAFNTRLSRVEGTVYGKDFYEKEKGE